MAPQEKFNVGGVLLDRPFKIRRLGHFGFNLVKMDEGVRFYTELLGFRVSDVIDYSLRATRPDQLAGLGDPRGYFTRYGSDHHALVLFNQRVREALGPRYRARPGLTINQITWQVGSLREVGNAIHWFDNKGVKIQRSGRDMPGSNWHTYLYDPDGHTNELYYGIEQIGWSGHSKPKVMYNRGFHEPPALPQISEFEEVQQALKDGVDLLSGYRYAERLPAAYEVDGILLPRPFPARPGKPFRQRRRWRRGLLPRYSGLHCDRGGSVARPSLRFHARQYRAPLARALPARPAREARHEPAHDLDGARTPARQLRAA
ncbi:MAG: VOC family protein [Deltaproteobacteria bacterium]|nr:VOC family protein [Deltaproteobacteria bacterium]